MVVVAAVDQVNMERYAGIDTESPHKFFDHAAVEAADRVVTESAVKHKIGASADVENTACGKRFVHGPQKLPYRAMPFLSPIASQKASPSTMPVFNSVVAVDLTFSFDIDIQIKAAVYSNSRKHVIEKADTGVDIAFSLSVETERKLNLRLLRAAGYCCFSRCCLYRILFSASISALFSFSLPDVMRR